MQTPARGEGFDYKNKRAYRGFFANKICLIGRFVIAEMLRTSTIQASGKSIG